MISIHAPRVGRDRDAGGQGRRAVISIHAPRVGRDQERANLLRAKSVFQSTRPVWGATTIMDGFHFSDIFQSTRPVWGATANICRAALVTRNFNPRAPCGARLKAVTAEKLIIKISIHAPRVGRDDLPAALSAAEVDISIHAPRVGRDGIPPESATMLVHFNPRAPCGARPIKAKPRRSK